MNCLSPLTLKQNGTFNHVPCGVCAACLSRRRDTWSFRLRVELKRSISAHFITFTYDQENEPWCLSGNPNFKEKFCNAVKLDNFSSMVPTLDKRDMQLFMKRLRIAFSRGHYSMLSDFLDVGGTYIPKKIKVPKIEGNRPKIKYYIVGEYGTKTNRPHYHGIFFNIPLNGDELDLMIRVLWKHGHILVGSVNDASIHYTTKYCINPKIKENEKEKEFCLISTKPAIGISYLQNREFHRSYYESTAVGESGKRSPLSKYYKDKIFTKLDKYEIKKRAIAKIDRDFNEFMEKNRVLGQNPFKVELEQKEEFIRKIKVKRNQTKL